MKRIYKLSTIANKVINKFQKLGPKGWMKGAEALDCKGYNINPLSKAACYFCNAGMVKRVIGGNSDEKQYDEINAAFCDVTGRDMISMNDNNDTTFKSNLAVWRKVQKHLEKKSL